MKHLNVMNDRVTLVAGDATGTLFLDGNTGTRIYGLVSDWDENLRLLSFGVFFNNWTLGFAIDFSGGHNGN